MASPVQELTSIESLVIGNHSLLDDHEVVDIEEAAAQRGQSVFLDKFGREAVLAVVGGTLDGELPRPVHLLPNIVAGFPGDSLGHSGGHAEDERVVE